MDNPHGGPRPLRLLDVEPDLAVGLSADEFASASSQVIVGGLTLPQGSVDGLHEALPAATAVLVLEGFVLNMTTIGDRQAADLYGPGEALGCGELEVVDLLASQTSRRCLTPVVLAVIDATAMQTIAAWPTVGLELLRRASWRSSRMSLVHAIRVLPGIDARVLTYLWHLAARWGRTSADGVLLDVPLTHEVLAAVLGSRRQTVTGALGRLRSAGLVADTHRGWRLSTDVGAAGARLPVELRWDAFAPHVPAPERPASVAPGEAALAERLASQRVRIAAARAAHTSSIEAIRTQAETLRANTLSLRQATQAAALAREDAKAKREADPAPGDGDPRNHR